MSGFQKKEEPAGASSGTAEEAAVAKEAESPDHAPRDAVRQLRLHGLAAFPVKEQHDRLVNGSERVGGFVQTPRRDELAVGRDGEPANATEVDLLTTVVRVQGLGVEHPGEVAAWRGPTAGSTPEDRH